MHELVIRGGRVFDGNGGEGFVADLAIDGGRITSISRPGQPGQPTQPAIGPGRREIDARGKIVTPGWVDIHTHYDGQVSWDPYVTPSGWHGVTTVVMGNCGVGFAPVRASDREWLIGLMEGVEDIPGAALAEGIDWAWESFSEYLDALAAMPRAMDIGAQVPHGALRVYVMGERGARHEAPRAEDLEAMGRHVAEAITAGALGFSTSRTMLHKDVKGELVPGTFAADQELLHIARAIKGAGSGVFQMTSNHVEMEKELEWMELIAADTGLKVCFNLVQTDESPKLWSKVLDWALKARKEGKNVVPNVAGRPAGILMGWQCVAHPFARHKTFQQAAAGKSFAELLKILRDPAFKARLLAEQLPELPPFETFITRGFHKMFELAEQPDYEPGPEQSILAKARAAGRSPAELAYEALMANEGQGLLYFPIFNYSAGDMQVLYELLDCPETCVSLGDGGAHCSTICDASIPTFMLTHWTRDRTRGPKLPLGKIIRKQTRDTAEVYGLMDRGRLEPGYKADINVIDYEALNIDKPAMHYDLPAGGKRLLQHATGYTATILSGQVVFENGKETGALPGSLIRGPQAAP